MATVYERLKKIIVKKLGAKGEEITPSASFADDLGADSLELVELIMAMEEEFSTSSLKINIPDEDAEKILTVEDAIDYLKDLGIKDD
ncbi:Acyl carrier protein [subsurface metagenome]